MSINFYRLRGFTLIELLVVIAIIGILSSVVIVSLNSSRAKARDARRISDMHQIRNALQLYYSQNNTYPGPYLHGGGGGDFIDSSNSGEWDLFKADIQPYIDLPSDPINNNRLTDHPTDFYSYGYYFDPSDGSEDYDLFTRLESKGDRNRTEFKHWPIHSGFHFGEPNQHTWDEIEPLVGEGVLDIYADH